MEYSKARFFLLINLDTCHPFTLSFQAQNITFYQLLSTIDHWYPPGCLQELLIILIQQCNWQRINIQTNKGLID